MSTLDIKIHGDTVAIGLPEEVEETDVVEMLKFDPENVEQLLTEHASRQVYWEALAIRLKRRLENFKEIWAKKWWAYNKVYAGYVMVAFGNSKPTISDVTEKCILIYSADTSENEKQKYAEAAFLAACKKNFHGSLAELYVKMYKYLKEYNPPWYFETVQSTLQKLQEEFDIVHEVAERFHSQGFHLDLYARMQMAKRYNIIDSISDGSLMRKIGGKNGESM